MKTYRSRWALLTALSSCMWLIACDDGDGDPGDASPGADAGPGDDAGADGAMGVLTEAEAQLAREMSPMPPMPASPTNDYADDPAAATLGQKFYFEVDWAGPLQMDSDLGAAGDTGKVSCFSCHDDRTFGSADNVGVGSSFHPRHAPGSVNAAWYAEAGYTWRGRFDVMWALPRAVFEAGAIYNSSRLRVAHVVFEQYRAEYDAVFGDHPLPDLADMARFPETGKPGDPSWDGMAPADQEAVNRVLANVGKALEAYQRTLQSTESEFDRWVAGSGSISESAQRGFALFVGDANCVMCHSGPFFTDQSYRNLGLEQTGPNAPATDGGRFDAVGAIAGDPFNGIGAYSDDPSAGQPFIDDIEPQTDALMGQFRVPTVRNAAVSAPFMHAGQLATLQAVIDLYDEGGGPAPTGMLDPVLAPLGLSAADKADLIAFIESLTGAAVDPALSMDTSN